MGLYTPDSEHETGKTKLEEEQYEILNIPLGDIFGVFNEEHNYTIEQKGWIDIRSKVYSWELLHDSLKENNYNPQKFSYIEVTNSEDKNADNIGNILELSYICESGNHRLKVLNETYPPTHKIHVKLKITE